MIYITGDTHGDIERFSQAYMPGESTWTADDKVIICGDFGFVWYDETCPEKQKVFDDMLDTLSRKPYEILFVDGNHENFDLLYTYPEVARYGSIVRQIRPNIFHLQRGRVYTIEGKTFFTFGGAHSIDKARRTANHLAGEPRSWWPQEQPSAEEYARGLQALQAVDFSVEYIVTHTAPDSALELLKYTLPPQDREAFCADAADMRLRSWLDMVWHNTRFKKWYFGHWHMDRELVYRGLFGGAEKQARAMLTDVERIE